MFDYVLEAVCYVAVIDVPAVGLTGDDHIRVWQVLIELPEGCPYPAFKQVPLDVVSIFSRDSNSQPRFWCVSDPGAYALVRYSFSAGECAVKLLFLGESPCSGQLLVQGCSGG